MGRHQKRSTVMNYFIRVESERSRYSINPNHIEVVRYLDNGEIRLEFVSGRIDYYRGSEAQQIINAMSDLEIPIDYANKPPNLNEVLD
jgi:hypothetical protein